MEEGSVESGEDGGTVSDKEASTAFGGFLEADEGCVGGGAFGGRFLVDAYVVTGRDALLTYVCIGLTNDIWMKDETKKTMGT